MVLGSTYPRCINQTTGNTVFYHSYPVDGPWLVHRRGTFKNGGFVAKSGSREFRQVSLKIFVLLPVLAHGPESGSLIPYFRSTFTNLQVRQAVQDSGDGCTCKHLPASIDFVRHRAP
jgi:hypothetical protein